MNTENSKINESNKFRYFFTDKFNLKNRSKYIALVDLSICYTWKNIKSAYTNMKFKISSPICNDEFDLLDGSYSVSDVEYYFEYIIKKHDTVAAILYDTIIHPYKSTPTKSKIALYLRLRQAMN